MSDTAHFRIGTRDSQLAVWQAEQVKAGLQSAGFSAELVFIKTKGDQILDTPLPLIGGKGLFTKALDDAQLAGEID
ncbi:MAG: hydroxymethylbilane synthase, partial [Bacteroidota bacterium]